MLKGETSPEVLTGRTVKTPQQQATLTSVVSHTLITIIRVGSVTFTHTGHRREAVGLATTRSEGVQ